MPFSRPIITAIRQQVLNDVLASPLGASGLLRFGPLSVQSYIYAGQSHEHYGFLDRVALEAVPFTCGRNPDTLEYLEAWAALVGILRKDASAATGTATFQGVPGSLIPALTELRGADGQSFDTTRDATLDGTGFASAPFVAVLPGSAGTTAVTTPLALASPIAGVQSILVSAAGLPGTDIENSDALRTRMLARYRQPPQGGAQADYLEWALAVPGVTRAWSRPNGFGAGTVVLYTMFDTAEVAHGGFPQGVNGVSSLERRDASASGDQLAVADAIFPLRPVTALVYSVAPSPWPLNFTINDLAISSASRAATQAAINAALASVLFAVGDPRGDTLYPSDFEAAISATTGVRHFTLASPSAPVTPPIGSLPVLGNVTYG